MIKTKTAQLTLSIFGLVIILLLQFFEPNYFKSFIAQINGDIYDSFIRWDLHKKPQAIRLVVIDIDDLSIQKEGRWPWPRDKFVSLIDNLQQAGVIVTALNIVFSEAEINYAIGLKDKILEQNSKLFPHSANIIDLLDQIAPSVDNDQKFAQILSRNETVLGYLFHHDPHVQKGQLPHPLVYDSSIPFELNELPIPEFEGYNGILPMFLKATPLGGFVSIIPDLDGVLRHGFMLAKFDNKLYPSLVLTVVMRYLLADKVTLNIEERHGKKILKSINVAGLDIPTNSKGQILIPFWGPQRTLDNYSASDIIQNKVPSNELAGSIAIIGSSMVMLATRHESPVTRDFPGVEMVANMVSGILSQQITKEEDRLTPQGFIRINALGLIAAVLFPFISGILLIILYIVLTCIIVGGDWGLFIYKNIYIFPAIPLISVTGLAIINFMYDFILERQQKNRIRNLFGEYVPTSYVKEIIDSPKRYTMDGETKNLTVFFADIRSFTTLSESLAAGEVKRLLNEFFTPITNIIFSHQGTIDKYVGDMVMAFWGAPLPDTKHHLHALQAALDIRTNLPEINEKLVSKNLPRVQIGMGISTGLMNVGDMGSSFRRSYTVIGDAVNLGSRLQDLTKKYKLDILVTDITRLDSDEILWRPVDKILVKGRTQPLMIYYPICYKVDAKPETISELGAYEQALDSYTNHDWFIAKTKFEKLVQHYPTTFVYQLYLDRAVEFCKNPPAKDSDLVFDHTPR